MCDPKCVGASLWPQQRHQTLLQAQKAEDAGRRSDLGDVAARPEDLDVLHQLLRRVLRVQHRQLGEHTRVGLLQSETL